MMLLLLTVFVGTFSALATYLLHTKYSENPVLISSALTFVVTGLYQLFADDLPDIFQHIPYLCIGGTFIGMSSRKKVKQAKYILIAGLIFSLIYLRSSTFFEGFGGALGTSACISVLSVISFRQFFKRTQYFARKKLRRET
ncbi:hypothetical protein MM213_18995 [Belliella sp. R4-6]|uniref:Uncharacterized protein n=1 Tax=Belliella alkalica TaxID=1730871 RepID=A0ABS9VGN0_9BACT|nr:hypothetical protein [Belliella alkalica]MCH7415597.1 hypothetical protein [Belliella alkalica]